jgi:hypothetical protein
MRESRHVPETRGSKAQSSHKTADASCSKATGCRSLRVPQCAFVPSAAVIIVLLVVINE